MNIKLVIGREGLSDDEVQRIDEFLERLRQVRNHGGASEVKIQVLGACICDESTATPDPTIVINPYGGGFSFLTITSFVLEEELKIPLG